MKNIFFILTILPFGLFSQVNQLFTESDTVKIEQRTGGKIDSMDMVYSNTIATTPAGGINLMNNCFNPKALYLFEGLQNFRTLPTDSPMRFSGIPHLGFTYSFGTKGSQFLHFDYQHAVSQKTLININSARNTSNGFTRNSKYSYSDIQFKIRRNAKKHSYLLKGDYSNRSTNLNGGIADDENINTQGLDLLPVNKYNSSSTVKIGNIKISNYFNFLNDSLKGLGISSKHQYEVTAREYFDSADTIKNPNFDTLNTRDQYRLASIRNSGGVYWKTNKTFIDVLVQHRYWDYQNLGEHRDTNEINLTSNLSIVTQKYSLKNEFSFNIIGAGNEWRNKTIATTTYKKIRILGIATIEQKWPEQFQRFYTANSYKYKLSDYKLQSKAFVELNAKYKFTDSYNLGATFTSATLINNYFFSENDSTWRSDTLTNIVFHAINLSSELKFGVLHIHPAITVNFPSTNFNYVSSTVVNSRIFIKKHFFKAKKLEGVMGVDLSWRSSHKLLSYNSILDVYTLNDTNKTFNSMSNLSAFIGFSLGQFRFYARVENIGYLWNDRKNQVLIGFPIQKNYIRIGLTWDFFN